MKHYYWRIIEGFSLFQLNLFINLLLVDGEKADNSNLELLANFVSNIKQI